MESSTRAMAVERGEPGPSLPVYHLTVLAEPFTSVVAELAGQEPTRSGGCVAVIDDELKPSAPSAAVAPGVEPEMLRLDASSVLIVIEPPWMVDGFEVPVIWSILLIRVWMQSVTLSWLPVAPEATKLSVVPLTVMVSPAEKPGAIELGAVPDSAVVPL